MYETFSISAVTMLGLTVLLMNITICVKMLEQCKHLKMIQPNIFYSPFATCDFFCSCLMGNSDITVSNKQSTFMRTGRSLFGNILCLKLLYQQLLVFLKNQIFFGYKSVTLISNFPLEIQQNQSSPLFYKLVVFQ